jgi:PTH2 family peptidyl-tRNA hydrolase
MKQLIIVRHDLKMTKGKIGAQVAHASMGAILKCMTETPTKFVLNKEANPYVTAWLAGAFTKVVLWIDSEQELLEIVTKAEAQDYLHCLITDNGKTEFNNKPTKTCVAVGPFSDDNYPEFCKGLRTNEKLRQISS